MAPNMHYSQSTDDKPLAVITRDVSGGQNNRQHPSLLQENQAKALTNTDIGTPGQRSSIPGITLIENIDSAAGTGAFNYDPQGGTANILVAKTTKVQRWIGSGLFTDVVTGLTTGLKTAFTKAFKTGTGDVALVFNGTDNVREISQTYAVTDLGNTNTSPPLTQVVTTFRNRVWALKNDLLYYSTAAPSNYATAFDRTTNAYRLPVGDQRFLLGTRDLGLIIGGKEQIWALNPSVTPAATDRPEKLSDIGCAAGKTAVTVADDYFYFGFDGVRGIKRTIQDKLQYGTSVPISYRLKTEFSTINWSVIDKATAIYWDNKYFLALPVNGSSTNNQVWIYYPATDGWTVRSGWAVGDWTTFKINGEERLYYIDATTGKFYRAWYGASDNGSAITFTEESRDYDLGQPLIKKVGGHLKVVAKPTGDYNLSIYGSFDDGEYSLLGSLNLSTSLISFPVTFPVTFEPDNQAYEIFHLDSYGPWYKFRYKLENSDIRSNADDITIYETSIISYPEEPIFEESTE